MYDWTDWDEKCAECRAINITMWNDLHEKEMQATQRVESKSISPFSMF